MSTHFPSALKDRGPRYDEWERYVERRRLLGVIGAQAFSEAKDVMPQWYGAGRLPSREEIAVSDLLRFLEGGSVRLTRTPPVRYRGVARCRGEVARVAGFNGAVDGDGNVDVVRVGVMVGGGAIRSSTRTRSGRYSGSASTIHASTC